MNLLLDTHTLIWFFDGAPPLSGAARSAIEEEGNRLFLSAASFVEMGIKISIGKLKWAAPSSEILASYRKVGTSVLDVNPSHGMALESLPFHHRDHQQHRQVLGVACLEVGPSPQDTAVPRKDVGLAMEQSPMSSSA